jgi:hypothetical protein
VEKAVLPVADPIYSALGNDLICPKSWASSPRTSGCCQKELPHFPLAVLFREWYQHSMSGAFPRCSKCKDSVKFELIHAATDSLKEHGFRVYLV